MIQNSQKQRKRGFTAVELMVVVAAMAIVTAAIYAVFSSCLRLYVSGVATSRTGFALRDIYDRVAMDIMQSPGAYAQGATISTSNPARLQALTNSPAPALCVARVVAGPLMVENFTGSNFTACTLIFPPNTADTQPDEFLAKYSTNDIRVGDYLKLTIGDAMEARITGVTKLGEGRWNITCETYKISFSSNPTTVTAGTPAAAYCIRYCAYVVLRNISRGNRNHDILAFYEGLKVTGKLGGVEYYAPSEFELPANHTKIENMSDIITTDLAPSTSATAGNEWNPFTTSQGSAEPVVDIRMGVEASEYDNITSVPAFYRTAELRTEVPLKSQDL